MGDFPSKVDAAVENDSSYDLMELYLREVAAIPLLDPEEEEALARRARAGDMEARRQLIKANLRLVISIAKRYMNWGVPLMDLIEEGNLGLIKAVERFDPTRGTRFSTYASWWIRQAVIRALASQGRTVRIPAHMFDLINKWLRVSHELTQKFGRAPSIAETACAMGLSEDKVKDIIRSAQRPTSLHEPVFDEDGDLVEDLLSDHQMVNPLDELERKFTREELFTYLSRLTARESDILRLRYGLDTGFPITLEEMGRRLGITRERVRQIEAKALKKLKHMIEGEEAKTARASKEE